MIGFFFLFLLGIFVLLPGDLEIPNGTTTTYTYNETILTSETSTPTYEYFNDFLSHFFGFWITLTAIFGFIMSIGDIKRGVPK